MGYVSTITVVFVDASLSPEMFVRFILKWESGMFGPKTICMQCDKLPTHLEYHS